MTNPKRTRRGLDAAELQRRLDAYAEHGTYEKAANAIGVSKVSILHAIRKSKGLCGCGKVPVEGLKTCPTCLERTKRDSERRIANRAAANTCRECDKPLAPHSRRFCVDHLIAGRAQATAWRKEHRSRGLCEHCNAEPLPGDRYCAKHRADQYRYGVMARSKDKFGGLLEAVLERDARTCQICGRTNCRIEVHHIRGRENGMDNLIALCTYCHKAITMLGYSRDPGAVWAWFQQHPPS